MMSETSQRQLKAVAVASATLVGEPTHEECSDSVAQSPDRRPSGKLALQGGLSDLKGRTLRGGFATICGQAVNYGLRLSSMVILARMLDPEDFGLVAMVTVVTGIYAMFTSAGLSSATVQRDKITHDQISTLFWINMLIGAFLAVLCFATAPLLVAFYREPRLFWVTEQWRPGSSSMPVGYSILPSSNVNCVT